MEEIKYMVNRGFESAEQQMLDEMSKYAGEGWILSSMTPARFELVKGDPQNLQYAMEYMPVLTNKKSYMESIKRSGWSYVCESEGFRIFSAPAGTKQLSVDRTQLNARIQLKKKRFMFMLFTGILFFVLFLMSGSYIGSGIKMLGAAGCAVMMGYAGAGLLGFRKKKEK